MYVCVYACIYIYIYIYIYTHKHVNPWNPAMKSGGGLRPTSREANERAEAARAVVERLTDIYIYIYIYIYMIHTIIEHIVRRRARRPSEPPVAVPGPRMMAAHVCIYIYIYIEGVALIAQWLGCQPQEAEVLSSILTTSN